MRDKCVQQFLPLVDAIAETFGRNCEVILHDLINPSKSIIKIANGHITGRDIDDPLTDFGLLLYERANNSKNNDFLIGYRTKSKNGLDLKSTTIFIRNNKGKVIACLCINIDITFYKSIQNAIEEICKTSDYDFGTNNNESPENFESSLDTLINELIERSIKKIGKPVGYMDKEDKLNIIRDLKQRGFFLIKGSSRRASKVINVSLPTIYKYLEEI